MREEVGLASVKLHDAEAFPRCGGAERARVCATCARARGIHAVVSLIGRGSQGAWGCAGPTCTERSASPQIVQCVAALGPPARAR